jgi:hypothetical protein
MIDVVKKVPPVSSLSAVFGMATLAGFFTDTIPDFLAYPMFLTLAASPLISPALAVPATINLFKKERSGLSKVFSAAAAVAGVGGLLSMASVQGPDALAAPIYSTLGMIVAGTLNVISNLTADTKVKVSVSTESNAQQVKADRPAHKP